MRDVYGHSALSRHALNLEPPVRILVEQGKVVLAGRVFSRVERELLTQIAMRSAAFEVENQVAVDAKVANDPVKAPHWAPAAAGDQRLRLRARRLRRLPFGRGRNSGPGAWTLKPPARGNDGPLDGRSVASLTRRFRPSSSWPSSFAIAAAAASAVENSTKAKPRGRPVSRSVGMKTLTISPAGANSARTCSDVVSKLRLPTKSLV